MNTLSTEKLVRKLCDLSDVNLKPLAVELGIDSKSSTKTEIIKSIALTLFERI